MTSSFTLNMLLKNEKHFLGCFHVKKLPLYRLKTPVSLIIYINKHWVSIVLVNKDCCLYFDSFGEGIQNKKLIRYLKAVYKKITFNKKKIQHDTSRKCGIFCMLFVTLVKNRQNFKKFLHLFDKNNLLINDHILYHILVNKNKPT